MVAAMGVANGRPEAGNARKAAAGNARKVAAASARPENVAPSREVATATARAGEIWPDRPLRGRRKAVRPGATLSHR